MAETPPPPGAPAGGKWSVEEYSGTTTLIIFLVILLLFWPACCVPFCMPCDQRRIYTVNGVKYVGSGLIVPPSDCCGKPCMGPAA